MNTSVRQRLHVPGQQFDVSADMVAQDICGVQMGIGFEIDSRRLSRGTRIDVDRQVFHRPCRQDVESTSHRPQDHFGVKVHDVDRRTEEPPLGTEASIAPHVLGAVPLMSERAGQFERGSRAQFGKPWS